MIVLPLWNHSLRLNMLPQTPWHHSAILPLLLNKANLTCFDHTCWEIRGRELNKKGILERDGNHAASTVSQLKQMLQFWKRLQLYCREGEERGCYQGSPLQPRRGILPAKKAAGQ